MFNVTPETYICSDTHLFHKNILEFEPIRKSQMLRDGFDNHEEWVIHKWNQEVSENDDVLFLGDFAFKEVANVSKRLNGNKTIILGNHDDKPFKQKWVDGRWAIVNGVYFKSPKMLTVSIHKDPMLSGLVMDILGERVLFSHYPLFEADDWDRNNKLIVPRIEYLEEIYKFYNCTKNIHGHTHSKKSIFKDSINVSFEQINFKPVKIKDLLKKD